MQRVDARGDAVRVGALEEQEARDRAALGGAGTARRKAWKPPTACSSASAWPSRARSAPLAPRPAGRRRAASAAPCRRPRCPRRRRGRRFASSRSIVRVGEPPEQRDALLDVRRPSTGPPQREPGGVAARRSRAVVLIASHISARDHVAHGARALAGALDAREHRPSGLVGVEVRRRSASHAPPARSPRRRAMIATSASQPRRTPARRPAGPGARLEDAVEHARGELGAREVAAQPVELVSDPGEHQPALPRCCCCCCCCCRPSRRRSAGRAARAAPRLGGRRRVALGRRAVLEHPRVLRAAAARGVDDHRALLSATRVRPPGTMSIRSPKTANGRRSTWRGASPPSGPAVGTVERFTTSCAIQRSGLARG